MAAAMMLRTIQNALLYPFAASRVAFSAPLLLSSISFARNASDSAAITATVFDIASLASCGMRPTLLRDKSTTSWTPFMYLSQAVDQLLQIDRSSAEEISSS